MADSVAVYFFYYIFKMADLGKILKLPNETAVRIVSLSFLSLSFLELFERTLFVLRTATCGRGELNKVVVIY